MTELEVSLDRENREKQYFDIFIISQNTERDNMVLKERLTTLTQEMEDATEKMNEMAEELNSAQIKSIEYKGYYDKVKQAQVFNQIILLHINSIIY